MSAENVEIIRRVYEAMARGDFWATGAAFDPEISWSWSPKMSGMTGVEEYRGIDGVEAATRDFFQALEWFRQEAAELIDLGDEVLALTRTFARPRGGEREIEGSGAELWRLRDGRVVRFRQFETREEALAAAGADRGA